MDVTVGDSLCYNVSGYTIIIVSRFLGNVVNGTWTGLFYISDAYDASYPRFSITGIEADAPGGNLATHLVARACNLNEGSASQQSYEVTPATARDNIDWIDTVVFDFNGQLGSWYTNGYEIGSVTGLFDTNANPTGKCSACSISRDWSNGKHWNGYIFEIMGFKSVLTNAQRHQLELYLSHKYNITITQG